MNDENSAAPLALIERLVQRIKGERDDPPPLQGRIPASFYLDESRARREHDALFLRRPLIIAHESQLPDAGDTLCYDWLGLPLITVRDRAGNIGTFVNACRHRGVRLLEQGQSCQRSLVCPYHQWTYGLDGALRNIPREESFDAIDPAARGLRRVPTEVRHGLVWVQATPDSEMDLDQHLAGLGPDLQYFEVPDYRFFTQSIRRVDCNWKLIQDAFLDGYHVIRLHKNTVGPFFPDAIAESDDIGLHIRSAVARNEITEAASLPREQWDGRRHCSFSYTIFPNVVLVLHPDYTSIIKLFPQGPHETLFVHSMLVPREPTTDKARQHYERSFDLIDRGVFEAEDIFVSVQSHRSLQSGAVEELLFGGLEEAALRFHQKVARELA